MLSNIKMTFTNSLIMSSQNIPSVKASEHQFQAPFANNKEKKMCTFVSSLRE